MIEIAIIGCDIQEVIGSAIAIFILSKGVIPLYAGKQPYVAQVHVINPKVLVCACVPACVRACVDAGQHVNVADARQHAHASDAR